MSGVPLRTLVVDDSSSVRKLLSELLRERGHEVTVLGSAEEALGAHAREPFQLILADWTLPGMSGLGLCQAVRAQPGGEDVVVLIVTGRNRPGDLQAVLDAGATDYLAKPIDPEALEARLLIAERTIEQNRKRASERQEMESRLAFADRMSSVGTLTAGVAHELNNPLMYVLSNLRLTREEIDAVPDADSLELARQQLDEAIHGAIQMQNIVRDLKTFSRDEEEQQGNVDLRSALESSINICWNEIRHRATLEREFGNAPPVDARESRLGQVFLNLLINAVQAMPERSLSENRITVRTRTNEEGAAVVEIEDNGLGIPPERMSRIFDPFFTTKSVSEGTGLGLSISRNIIRDAGGTIEVRSEVGKGSTFIICLPASARTRRPKPSSSVPAAAVHCPARVVVIDDEPLVSRSIRRALRGHEVEVFSRGTEAIERLCGSADVDIIFCDLMMPEVSGMDVFERVSNARPELASRFIFMTGGAFTRKARAFLKRTRRPCLEKPFELRQVRELVNQHAPGAASDSDLVAMGGLEPPT